MNLFINQASTELLSIHIRFVSVHSSNSILFHYSSIRNTQETKFSTFESYSASSCPPLTTHIPLNPIDLPTFLITLHITHLNFNYLNPPPSLQLQPATPTIYSNFYTTLQTPPTPHQELSSIGNDHTSMVCIVKDVPLVRGSLLKVLHA